MVTLLFPFDILVESGVGYGKLAIEELRKWVIHCGSASDDLGIVCVEVGVDHVDVVIDGGSIDR
jgi:hypothetical protein